MTLAESISQLVAQVAKIGGETGGLLQRIAALEDEVSRLRKLVVPIRWTAFTPSFTNGTVATVNVATYLQNSQNLMVTYSVVGTLPAGCTFAGSTLSYNGSGAAATASVVFRAVSGAYTVDTAPTVVTIAAAPPVGNRAPVWTTVPTQNVTQGTTYTAGLSGYVSDPDGDPLTFGRTGSTSDTAPSAITVNNAGLLTVPNTVAAGTYDIEVYADDGYGSADSDWLLRSSGAGVVWAHDFREAGEINPWRYDSGASFPPAASVFDPYFGAPSFGTSRSLVSRIIASTLANTISAGTTAIVLTDASDFPDPASSGTYDVLLGVHSYDGTQESATVTAKSGNTLTVTRGGGAATRAAGTGCSVAQRTYWNRPLGAFAATVNGKSSPDIGIANGFRNRTSDWQTVASSSHYRYRGAYWGHSSYQALYNAAWPISGYDTVSSGAGRSFTNTFDGTEFWLQFRMKISASRFTQTASQGVPGKLFYLQTASGSTGQQIYFKVNPPSKNFACETNFGTEIVNTAAWQYTTDEWVTYLLHLKPGRNGVAETVFEIFAARPGATAYTTVYSNSALALVYSGPAPDEGNPPAYNNFSPVNYANHYVGSGSVGPSTSTHSVEYTQIILSSQSIPVPLA